MRWLPLAADARRAQIDFIGERDPRAALHTGDRVQAASLMLERHPSIGRPGRRPGTRELVVSRTPFIIVYRVDTDAVTVLRFLHGAQDRPDAP